MVLSKKTRATAAATAHLAGERGIFGALSAHFQRTIDANDSPGRREQ